MIYQFYQAQADMLRAVQTWSRVGASLIRQMDLGRYTPPALKQFGAMHEMVLGGGLTHLRPPFGVESVRMGNRDVQITEEVADETPFASLLHFKKDTAVQQPRVLVVAPMSGHFATLLRGTVQVLLPEHDLYITDWKNARDVPLRDGRFDLDAFIDHIIRFFEAIGPGGHVIAVCQPTVPVLAAVSVMAQNGNRAQPRSMTLMAGPIDTRINPTKVNELAQSKSIGWFEKNMIGTVPWRYEGAGRRVYPGFMQLTAFMSMNIERHVAAHLKQFRDIVNGDLAAAAAHQRFYDEYLAVMDLAAEFYLQTVESIFQKHDLPLGEMRWHGVRVEPAAIRRTALFTVEGERDDICAIGQTLAAQDLCEGVRPAMRAHHLQAGVGHYGVFSGSRWAREIYPRVRQMIQLTS
jgi:poly(3-hydroxybutyrate) depolymerase